MKGRMRKRAVTIHDRCLWFWTEVLRGIRQVLLSLTPSSLFPYNPNCSPQYISTSQYQQVRLPQNILECQSHKQCHDKIQQLPSIYSGIGLGVYQGEIVTFRLMAIGDKRWVVSKLRYEDLSQLPPSVLSEVCLELCLLRLYRIQSDLVKNGLQTKGGIELMKSYCPQADNLNKLLIDEADGNNPSVVLRPEFLQQQNQCHLKCLVCQKCSYDS